MGKDIWILSKVRLTAGLTSLPSVEEEGQCLAPLCGQRQHISEEPQGSAGVLPAHLTPQTAAVTQRAWPVGRGGPRSLLTRSKPATMSGKSLRSFTASSTSAVRTDALTALKQREVGVTSSRSTRDRCPGTHRCTAKMTLAPKKSGCSAAKRRVTSR